MFAVKRAKQYIARKDIQKQAKQEYLKQFYEVDMMQLSMAVGSGGVLTLCKLTNASESSDSMVAHQLQQQHPTIHDCRPATHSLHYTIQQP